MKQKVYLGYGSIQNLRKILHKNHPRKICLVTGKNSYASSGAEKLISPILQKYKYIKFSDFEKNPNLEDIKKGMDLFKSEKCDFIIAVGGGSALDIGKSISILALQNGNITNFVKATKKLINRKIKLVLIPTTSGTGSESTHFAVIYIGKTKYSLAHSSMLAEYAIVDPIFTLNLPKYITACTGMDALCQAIESYWSINSTNESKKYAKKAIKLIIKNLPKAVNKPSKHSREAMAKAANLSGRAINISKTTAPHAISYPIASYFKVLHGHAVALTIAPMLLYNAQVREDDILDKRGTSYVRQCISEIAHLLGARDVQDAADKIFKLMKEINLTTKLHKLGIKTKNDYEIIIKHGFNPDRVSNNPRRLSEEALRCILNKIEK